MHIYKLETLNTGSQFLTIIMISLRFDISFDYILYLIYEFSDYPLISLKDEQIGQTNYGGDSWILP